MQCYLDQSLSANHSRSDLGDPEGERGDPPESLSFLRAQRSYRRPEANVGEWVWARDGSNSSLPNHPNFLLDRLSSSGAGSSASCALEDAKHVFPLGKPLDRFALPARASAPPHTVVRILWVPAHTLNSVARACLCVSQPTDLYPSKFP